MNKSAAVFATSLLASAALVAVACADGGEPIDGPITTLVVSGSVADVPLAIVL
jgi:hypothetical protein